MAVAAVAQYSLSDDFEFSENFAKMFTIMVLVYV